MTTWTVRGPGRILIRMAAEIVAVDVDFSELLPEADGVVTQLVPLRLRPTPRTLLAPLRLRSRQSRARRGR